MKMDYVVAAGLGLSTRHGPVFGDVSLSFPQGSVAVIQGRSGTGRSALLLAIGGRMRGLTGSLQVAGFDGLTQSKRLRKVVSVARIGTLVDLEGQLAIADSITERALTDGLPTVSGHRAFSLAEEALGANFDRDLLVDDLTALDRTLLAVALGTLLPARVLLLDDADRNVDLADQRALMSALLRIADTGITVVTSTIETEAVPEAALTVSLPTPSRPSPERT